MDFAKILTSQQVFQDLTASEVDILVNHASTLEIKSHEQIISEGEQSSDIYFVEKGELEVTKKIGGSKDEFVIGHLSNGEMFGEMSFIDSQPRSTTIRSTTPTILYKLALEDLNSGDSSSRQLLEKITTKLSMITLTRVRNTNSQYVLSIKNQIQQLEMQTQFGLFFVLLITFYSIQSFIYFFINYLGIKVDIPVISWMKLVSLLIPSLFFVKYINYSLNTFGLNAAYAKQAILDTLVMLLSAFLLIAFSYRIFIGSWESLMINLTPTRITQISGGFFGIFIYILFLEFLIRGVMQTSLQKFLDDEKGFLTVFIVADLLWLFDLYLGFGTDNIKFMLDLLLGYIFLLQKSIIGVVIIHFVITALTGSFY